MKNIFIFLVLSFFLLGCADKKTHQLKHALELSGKNKPELEKVLEYYSDNPEKLRAAKFLIMNMPGHYSLDYHGREEFILNVDEYYADKPYYIRKLIYNLPPYYGASSFPVYDITTLNADFLIHHIDFWFQQRENLLWIGEIPNDIFYNYLLPYRQNEELIDKEFYTFAKNKSDSLRDLAKDYEWIKNKLINHLEIVDEHIIPVEKGFIADSIYLPLPFDKKVKLNCFQEAIYYNFLYKAYHVPSALDLASFWGHIDNGHAWCSAITGLYRHTQGFYTNTPVAKAHRVTYAYNPLLSDKNYIPDLFKNPFYKDVTNEYVFGGDVKVKSVRKEGFMYLAVFNNRGLKEIAAAPIRSRKAKFSKMGKIIMYFPVTYDGHIQKAAGDPFYITPDNKKVVFKPDKKNLKDVIINRKYNFDLQKIIWSEEIIGTTVEIASDKNFNDAEIIYVFKDRNPGLCTIKLNLKDYKPIRYVRITPKNDSLFLAEISILRKGVRHESYEANKTLSKLFDNDILTYSLLKGELVIDLGEHAQFESIAITPRTDDNGIVPGEEYELLYFNKGWISLGKNIADSNELFYKNIPSNAVYWLRNHTKGIEERIFTIDNEGLQRYW